MSLKRHDEDGQTETSQNLPQEQQLSPNPDEEVIISEKTGLPEVRKKLQEPTAVPQAEPKQQSTTSKKQPLSQPEPKKEEKVFFTRELMHRDAERVRREYSQARKLQQQEDIEMEDQETQEPEIIIPELDEIDRWARGVVQDLSEDTENAKNNQRVMIMATSVIKMCQLLQNYSVTMKSEMEKIAERELQNLNLQEQYAKSLKASTGEITRGIYDRFKEEQKQAFDDVKTVFSDSCDRSEKKIVTSADKVQSVIDAATTASQEISASVERFRKVKTFGDFLYYTAPIYVVLDLVLKIVTYFVQR